jgi:hypothetical protein
MDAKLAATAGDGEIRVGGIDEEPVGKANSETSADN